MSILRGLATFVRSDTATALVKRFVKDTLVSGCATLCVSLALSSITKTVVPAPAPRPEARRAVEVAPVQPVPEMARSMVTRVDRPGLAGVSAAGDAAGQSSRRAATAEDNVSRERPRRAAVVAPRPAPAAPIVLASPVVPVSVAATPTAPQPARIVFSTGRGKPPKWIDGKDRNLFRIG